MIAEALSQIVDVAMKICGWKTTEAEHAMDLKQFTSSYQKHNKLLHFRNDASWSSTSTAF